MTLLSALLDKRDPVEERAITPSQLAWARGEDFPGTNGATGVRIDRDTMLGVSAVWACVSLISDSVATLPLGVYTGDFDEAPVRADVPGWFDRPNPEQTLTDFKFGCVASMLLHGNAYIYLVRDAKLNILEAWLLDPRWVYVRREFRPDGTLGLNYYVTVGKGMQSPVGPFVVPAGPDMFHIMAFQPSSSWPMGIGPLDVAQMMFGSAIAGQEMGGRWFSRGFNAAGVLEAPDDVTLDQAQQVKRDFAASNTGGPRKMHLPPVLTGGMTYKQIQISPEQAQFLQQRQFSVDEVARWFRVPPHMIGNLEKTSSWGAGIEEQSKGFVQFTLRPWLERIEKSWTRNMLTFNPGQRFMFDVSDMLVGNMQAMAEFSLRMHASGALTANEIRSKYLRMAPFAGGDTHYFMVNTAPVGTEPILPVKDKVIESDVPAPVKGGVAAGTNLNEGNSVTLDDLAMRINENGNGHRANGERRFTITTPPIEIPAMQPQPILLTPPPIEVTVPAPPPPIRRSVRKIVEFADGRTATVVATPTRDGGTRKTVEFGDGRSAVVTEETVKETS